MAGGGFLGFLGSWWGKEAGTNVRLSPLAVTCYSLELLQEFGNISGSGLVRTFFHETEFYVV